MLLYETILIPAIYIRLIYNILKTESNILNAMLLVLAWLLIGPFYLLYNLIIDMYYYFKVLFEYHEDDLLGQEQEEEDEMQDKIIIYNEIIDTMRAIMNIFKHKKRRLRLKKKKGAPTVSPRKTNVHEEFGMRKEDEDKPAD